ncbi:MAG: FAD-binding oxidoreductase [Acidobacteriota bacterium]|nr:FAD-binding oxidoreductase [Acidobacteriota bacterium]
MVALTPASAQELAGVLRSTAASARPISVVGNNSKCLMGGPSQGGGVVISTSQLNRVLQYEPNDLTVSVEAGMRWADLQLLLAARGQMVALDPPFWPRATVGGVVASNSSGPLRKSFGTARDLVIGMQFAMLDGKIIRAGGMVVKNVAGLDMGKLIIGSFGTLAVITSVNFRLHSVPEQMKTFLFSFSELAGAIEKREAVLKSVLRPLAVDLVGPAAAARLGQRGYLLAVRAGGSPRVLDRYASELSGSRELDGADERFFWEQIREFPAEFLRRQGGGIILRISTSIQDLSSLLRLLSGAFVSRAASAVTYVYLNSWQSVAPIWRAAAEQGWKAVVEFAPEEIRSRQELWLPAKSATSDGFAMMKSVKQMFDPGNLLNRSRLYGRL